MGHPYSRSTLPLLVDISMQCCEGAQSPAIAFSRFQSGLEGLLQAFYHCHRAMLAKLTAHTNSNGCVAFGDLACHRRLDFTHKLCTWLPKKQLVSMIRWLFS